MTSFALFDTAIGTCGIVWSSEGIAAVQLPEDTPAATRERLRRRHPNAVEAEPSGQVRETVDDIVALLRGEPRDLAAATLDLRSVPDFHRQVYDAARRVRPGQTSTYGSIAAQLGDPTAARAVGQALGRNPIPIIVPCHRVLAANGRLGGFSATGGAETKRRMLVIEGALTDLFAE